MYATQSLSELKSIADKLNIVPTGDKRSKQSWIAAIESALLSESMPELPTHAEQESIAVTADMKMAVTTEVESVTETVTTESITSEVGTKRGAATVFTALVVMVIVAIRAIVIGGYAIVQCGLYVVRLVGKYNPALDLWHQLQPQVEVLEPSYS